MYLTKTTTRQGVLDRFWLDRMLGDIPVLMGEKTMEWE